MQKIVIANIKMNLLSPLERDKYLDLLEKEIKNKKLDETEFVLCPPAIHLEAFLNAKKNNFSVGAQNIFWERAGSFTGEISPTMVKNAGAEYVILGHSERRKYFGESDKTVNLKIKAALKIGLKPILCIGEKANERGVGPKIIMKQLDNCLNEITQARLEQIVICYEPVWAISSNGPAELLNSDEIMSMRLLIKKFLVKKYGKKSADKVRIIYGGSVSAADAKEICVESGMDGALVGKASLIPFEFVKIAEILNS